MRILERIQLTANNAGELEEAMYRAFKGQKLSLRMAFKSKNLEYVSRGLDLLEASVPPYMPYQFLIHLNGLISDMIIARFDDSPTYEWLGKQTLWIRFRDEDTAVITISGNV